MLWFRKHYTCSCGNDWWKESDRLFVERCGECEAEVNLDDYEDISSLNAVRELNDTLRKTLQGGTLVLSAEVKALPFRTRRQVLSKMRAFHEFTGKNDPFGEHDFGHLDVAGVRFLWKIEIFDKKMRHSSESPGDPNKSARVLTLMLARE